MKNKEFNKFITQFRKSQDDLIIRKGHDYTQGNADRLHNFKYVATLTGLTPLQVWSVYWFKHVFAIATFVKYGAVKSEDITSRFIDENNYNLLGAAILQEERSKANAIHPRRRRRDSKKTKRAK